MQIPDFSNAIVCCQARCLDVVAHYASHLHDEVDIEVAVEADDVGVLACLERTLAVEYAHDTRRRFGHHAAGVFERNAGLLYAGAHQTVHRGNAAGERRAVSQFADAVFQNDAGVEGGIAVDANVSVSLINNIFFKNAPLHDGAVVIDDNRIVAAKCILPVTQSNVPKSYGTRHRAAIGLSEITDAVVVVVSEETGGISIVKNGSIKHNIDPQKFATALKRALGQK